MKTTTKEKNEWPKQDKVGKKKSILVSFPTVAIFRLLKKNDTEPAAKRVD